MKKQRKTVVKGMGKKTKPSLILSIKTSENDLERALSNSCFKNN